MSIEFVKKTASLAYRNIMAYFRNMKFQNKLILLFLVLTVIPFVILGILTFTKSSEVIMQEVIENSSQLVGQVSDKIDYNMKEVDKNTLLFLWDSHIQSILSSHYSRETLHKRKENQMEVEAAMQTFLNTRLEIESVYIYRDDGDEYYIDNSSFGKEVRSRIVMKRSQIYADASNFKGTYAWMTLNLDKDLISGARIIYDTIALNNLGLLIINLQENYIRDLYNDVKLSPNGFFVIEDGSGRIISTNSQFNTDQLYTILNEKTPVTVANNNYEYSNTARGSFYIIESHSGQTGWKVIGVIPKYELLKGIYLIGSNFLFTGLLCTLMSVILLLVLSSYVIQPVKRLMKLMKKVEQEDFNVKAEVYGKDELGELTMAFNKMVEKIRYLIEEVYQEQIVNKEAEYKLLQAQINPHFLYNTLDSINWIAKIKGVEDISKMVLALGQLMRISIAKGKDIIPLSQELDYINNYLVIQSMRYRDKFKVNWLVEEQAKKQLIPKMLLQPIIENALVHGIEKKIGKGEVTIKAELSGEMLQINIIDDGAGMEPDKCKEILRFEGRDGPLDQNGFHTGIGLSNVNRRIKMMYGLDYGLEISSSPGKGADVLVRLPLLNTEKELDYAESIADR